jgi:hypothetical protein
LSSAGSTVYGWYEGSKNYTRASKYALDSVESSVKYVAGTAATVVKRPITAVDSFAVKQLVKLEEKVPAIKTETGDVLEALGEQKTAVCSRFSSGKDAITTRLVTGKEAVTTTIQGGKDTLVGYLHAGSEAIANTRPGCLVGSGVNRTLQVTENIVDYLLPEQEEEKERASVDAEEKEVKVEEKVTSEVKGESNGEEVDGEGEEEEEEEAKGGESKVTRVKNISRKVKLRVYYRTLRRLDTVQQQCKSTLEQLKMNIDLLRMAHGCYEGVDKQYKQLQSCLKNVRQHLTDLVTHPKTAQDPTVVLLNDSDEKEIELESLSPTEKATLFQGVLDYAKQLSEKVFTAFQTVSTATTYLPHHLKTGTTQAFTYSQELYTTLKSAKVPTDIPASVLHRTSEVVETQLGYVKQLGTYIRTALKAKEQSQSTMSTELKTFSIPDEAQEDSSDSEVGEPPLSRPPGDEGGQVDALSSSEDEQ